MSRLCAMYYWHDPLGILGALEIPFPSAAGQLKKEERGKKKKKSILRPHRCNSGNGEEMERRRCVIKAISPPLAIHRDQVTDLCPGKRSAQLQFTIGMSITKPSTPVQSHCLL